MSVITILIAVSLMLLVMYLAGIGVLISWFRKRTPPAL